MDGNQNNDNIIFNPVGDNSAPEPPMDNPTVEQPIMETPTVPEMPVENVAEVQAQIESPTVVPQVAEVPLEQQAPVETVAQPEVTTPTTEMVEPQKRSKAPIIVVILLLVVAAVVVIFVIKPFSKENSSNGGSSGGGNGKATCIEKIKTQGTMSSNGVSAIIYGDTQYIMDVDYDFITAVADFDDLLFNICYTDEDISSVNFQAFSTTKTKKVVSYEIYDSKNDKILEAKDTASLLKELGYHSYGKHTEEAKVVNIGSTPGFGYSGEKTYSYYDVEIEFNNGTKVEAKYKVFSGTTNKIDLLKENEKYTFNFEVSEGTLDPVEYTITDFN